MSKITIKIKAPRTIKGTLLDRFWNELFFWCAMISSIKIWLSHRDYTNRDKALITINGKEYYVKHITITNGHIFLDGVYVGPGDIESITITKED